MTIMGVCPVATFQGANASFSACFLLLCLDLDSPTAPTALPPESPAPSCSSSSRHPKPVTHSQISTHARQSYNYCFMSWSPQPAIFILDQDLFYSFMYVSSVQLSQMKCGIISLGCTGRFVHNQMNILHFTRHNCS